MRKGTFTRSQRLVAIAATSVLIASLAVASATSGVKITAGEMEMSMAVSAERGLDIRVVKAGRRTVDADGPGSSLMFGDPTRMLDSVHVSLGE